MKHSFCEFFVLINSIWMIKSTLDTSFDEDLVHSFLIKPEKLIKSERLKSAGDGFLEKSAYKVTKNNVFK